MFNLTGHTFRARESLILGKGKQNEPITQSQCRHAQHLPANFANLSNRIFKKDSQSLIFGMEERREGKQLLWLCQGMQALPLLDLPHTGNKIIIYARA